ncbi:hypothetical protein [Niabella ginsengisoli]|uniref:Uncharacterized protein n=1 Tax=Niabella ginsengisoli TaxID=522298 RepID=A0ABS9SHW9_9BACT|nr:hypothetical protein [Niabella ginsengisoli]MCH5597963.1 hypothetical protein [Niabella ginsengisoli]
MPQASFLLTEEVEGTLSPGPIGGTAQNLIHNWFRAKRYNGDTAIAVLSGTVKFLYLNPAYKVRMGEEVYDSVVHKDWLDSDQNMYLLSGAVPTRAGLPLIAVNAQIKSGDIVDVVWNVGSEFECDYYLVEAGKDSTALKIIAKVESKSKDGNSNKLVVYEYSGNYNMALSMGFGLAFLMLLIVGRWGNKRKYWIGLCFFVLGFAGYYSCKKRTMTLKPSSLFM